MTIFIFTLHFSLFTIHSFHVTAQVPTVQDCLGAIPVCQEIYIQETTYLGSGNYPNEIYNNPGNCLYDCPGSCLDGEQNSVWYVFTVQESGLLRMTISPFYNADDYDWAVYDITVLRCTDIYTQYSLMQKSCNAWGSSTFNGPTGISSTMGGTAHCNHCGDGSGTSKWNADLAVTAGRTYVLIIENWGTTPQGGYTLDFSASTASIFDNVRPYLQTVHSEDITCGTTQVVVDFSENVMCASVDATDFLFTGPGGPYTVIAVSGQVCELGGTMEKTYTLTLDRAIGTDGDYAVQLVPMNFVYDACNNFALGNTVAFSISLGAPVINSANMAIQPATCGLSNGYITGIQVSGTPPFYYLWTNQSGMPVGTQLNLLNVPTGNYTLKVTDNNTCATFAGPFHVDQTGAPFLEDAGIVITGANFGANNGHITGLVITGNEPFTFSWTDDESNVVGTALDLHDVYAGNYYLHVTDTYGCDTTGGPYFVQQIGGPLGVQAMADPAMICYGESSQLMANPFGGTGDYTYSWSSNHGGFSSELQSPVVFPTITTIYTVVVSDGYIYSEASTTVQVHALPVSNAGDDQTIPYGTSTTIYGYVTGGTGIYNYQWEPAGLLINPGSATPATKNLYQTTLFRLRGLDVNTGCVSTYDTVIVHLDGGPLGVTLSAQADTICIGETTTLQAYGFGGNYDYYTYTWIFGGEIVKIEQNPVSSFIFSPTQTGNHVFTVEVFDGFNTSTSQITLVAAQTPYFAFTLASPVIACPFDTISLKPNHLYPGASYYWSNGAVSPEIKVGSTGIGFESRAYHLRIVNTNGCEYADSVVVVFDFAACSGIDESVDYPAVRIFPNPSTGVVSIVIENGEGFSGLQIMSANGKVIFSDALDQVSTGPVYLNIDLSSFPGGVYILRLIHDRKIQYEKIILH
ncbi:MAG: T9SS type A sorting domain-containing protein [Bacteroidales bacterium]|nr:T9SS type A sorting domain-containing protein [Bacteroidales bacterium]